MPVDLLPRAALWEHVSFAGTQQNLARCRAEAYKIRHMEGQTAPHPNASGPCHLLPMQKKRNNNKASGQTGRRAVRWAGRQAGGEEGLMDVER